MISESKAKKIRAGIPGLLCLLVLGGILAAGLWPFRGPLNGVTWLENENGLRLSGDATLWSSGSFQTTGQPDDESRSLELWVQPGLARASGTILAFSSTGNSGQLSAHQYHSLFILTREIQGGRHRTATIGI